MRTFKYETTGLIGYTIALTEPVYDKATSCRRSSSTTPACRSRLSSHRLRPGGRARGKSLMQTDCVGGGGPDIRQVRAGEVARPPLWTDIGEMFPGFDEKVEWKFAYKCIGCDGLAASQGQVGAFKPDVVAPGVEGL